MKIPFISRLFPSRTSPKNSFWGSAYRFLFGTSSSGKVVNERTALQTTAVYSCVRILAETIASFAFRPQIATHSGANWRERFFASKTNYRTAKTLPNATEIQFQKIKRIGYNGLEYQIKKIVETLAREELLRAIFQNTKDIMARQSFPIRIIFFSARCWE